MKRKLCLTSRTIINFTFRSTFFNTTDDNIWQPIIFLLQIFFIKLNWYFILHFFSLSWIIGSFYESEAMPRRVSTGPLKGMNQWPLPFLKLKCSNFIFEYLIFGQKWCFIRIAPDFPRHFGIDTRCKTIKKHLSVVRD